MQRTWKKWGALGAVAIAIWQGGASEARAQLPGETVVYETVAPATRTVTYGEAYRIRTKPRKTVIKQRPVAIVSATPPVVRETRYIQPAPIVERQVIQPAPIVESRWIQPAPVLERRVIQPAPVVQTQVIRAEPVYQTRYLVPYR